MIKQKLKPFILPFVLLLFWELFSKLEVFQNQLLVPPDKILATTYDLWKSGELVTHLQISLLRVLAGFSGGAFAGIIIGACMGCSRRLAGLLNPIIKTLRQIPLFAWVPLLIEFTGIGEIFKIVFIALGAFFPMMLNAYEGIKSVPGQYQELARVYGYHPWLQFIKIILPATAPYIFTGIKASLGFSWMLMVGAELIGTSSGIGYMLTWGRQLLQLDVTVVGLLVVGLVGAMIQWLLNKAERYILFWQYLSKPELKLKGARL